MLFTKQYSAQIVKDRVREMQKANNIRNSDLMMEELGINVNAVRQMTDKKGIGCFALAKIADRLETSTDYLLGRTDNKEMNITITAAPTISRTGELSTTTTGGIEHITINEDTSETTEEKEILKMIKSLSAVQKARIILMIDEMKKEGEKNE